MRIIPVVLLALALSAPVEAGALKWKLAPYVALSSGQALDAASTLKFLQGTRCVEGNRHFGPRPSAKTIIGAKVGVVAYASALVWLSDHYRVPKAVRWTMKGVAYFGGVVGAKDGIRNLHYCGW